MVKRLIFAGVLTAALTTPSAWAGLVAMFTGSVQMVQTVTGQTAYKCEYDYVGRKFYKLFRSAACPSTIEVE